jgi:hypothetical protein
MSCTHGMRSVVSSPSEQTYLHKRAAEAAGSVSSVASSLVQPVQGCLLVRVVCATRRPADSTTKGAAQSRTQLIEVHRAICGVPLSLFTAVLLWSPAKDTSSLHERAISSLDERVRYTHRNATRRV